MTCKTCDAPLRASNTIGRCRKHRRDSEVYRQKKTGYEAALHRANPDRLRNAALQNRYGITLADKQAMYAAQNGECAICERPIGFEKSHTDHNHETGRVRGLLCAACNVGIGLFQDSPARLLRVIDYLTEPD